jgi:thiamine biosynthesis lipoprotein
MEAETRFPAMGSDVHVIVVGGNVRLLDVARELIDDLESRWSRFRPGSEVSLMNAMAGHAVHVSTDTLELVCRALDGARITDGCYDPTVLGAVLRAGYDRSFELLHPDATPPDSSLGRGFCGILVDAGSSTVTLPDAVGFDPGGIGKGFAADLLTRTLIAEGAAGVCANIGGDLRAEGVAPGGGAWVIGIEHPFRRDPAVVVGLVAGAVATSTRTRRVLGPTEGRRHHLIDPQTGEPATSGLASATAIAAEGWQAEVLSKAAFVQGAAGAMALFERTGVDGLVVDDGGCIHTSRRLRRLTGSSPAPSEPALLGMLP